MTTATYQSIREYFHTTMKTDVVHDIQHVERVLRAALMIAQGMPLDQDVLIAACLLHDIGRERGGDHAKVGAKMAYDFLLGLGWEEARAAHCRDCIATHRYRGDSRPATIEAQVLFDADKLDVSGAIGVARTLQYGGMHDEPLYLLDAQGRLDLTPNTSFVGEYHFKLKRIIDMFHTEKAKEMARQRLQHMRAYYEALLQELDQGQREGKELLENLFPSVD